MIVTTLRFVFDEVCTYITLFVEFLAPLIPFTLKGQGGLHGNFLKIDF